MSERSRRQLAIQQGEADLVQPIEQLAPAAQSPAAPFERVGRRLQRHEGVERGERQRRPGPGHPGRDRRVGGAPESEGAGRGRAGRPAPSRDAARG
jgi:hypothetical protein